MHMHKKNQKIKKRRILTKLEATQKFLDEGAGYCEQNLINAIHELIAHLCYIRVETTKRKIKKSKN